MRWRFALIGLLLSIVLLGAIALVLSGRNDTRRADSRPSVGPMPAAPQAPLQVDFTSPATGPARAPVAREETALEPATPLSDPQGQDAASSITGRVVDDLGDPLDRFVIEAEPDERGGSSQREARAFQRSFEDANGAFRLELPAGGQWQLRARASGERRSAPALVVMPGPIAGLVLVVARSARVAGVVVGAGAGPLSGAAVYLASSGEPSPHLWGFWEPEPSARTDALGRFELEGILPGAVRILARRAGYADSDWIAISLPPDGSVHDILIELDQGGRIEGLVDPSMGRIDDRMIDIYSLRGTIGWQSARTNSNGRFVFKNVIPQDYIIQLKRAARDGPEGESKLGSRKPISVEAGRTTQVHFVLPDRLITVLGQVRSDGMPLHELRVAAHSKGGSSEDLQQGSTDPQGRFVLEVAEAGDYTFSVSAGEGSYAHFERTVPDQDLVEVSFDLPGGAITGRVVSVTGRAAAGVPLTLVRSGWTDTASFYREHRRVTNARPDGTFEFRLLPPGTYTLRTPDGFQDGERPLPVPYGRTTIPHLELGPAQTLELEVQLQPGCRLSGLVVDRHGNAVSSARIRLMDAEGVSISSRWETRTDAVGNFIVTSIAPGSYTAHVVAGEHELTSTPFTVTSGKTTSLTIEMR